MIDINGEKVLVTGGSSMIGSAVIESLQNKGAFVIAPTHEECDLLVYDDTARMIDFHNPKYVVHCAGWNGGIKFNKDYPASIFFRTATMALNVLNCCARYNVDKVVSIISSCAYPDLGNIELSESNLWNGLPNNTVECHGLSKRILHAYGRQLSKQYNIKCISAILTNCYGIGDSFNPDKTKVVGAIINKIVHAKQHGLDEVICWGTGRPLRELMFSADAGEAITQTLLKCDYELMNIGSDIEVSIKELTEIVAKLVGYKGKITWDSTKPDGQMRKKLDTSLMNLTIDFKRTSIEEGLKQTIDWYLKGVS